MGELRKYRNRMIGCLSIWYGCILSVFHLQKWYVQDLSFGEIDYQMGTLDYSLFSLPAGDGLVNLNLSFGLLFFSLFVFASIATVLDRKKQIHSSLILLLGAIFLRILFN